MLVCLISLSPHLSDEATATPLGGFIVLIEMRHSSKRLRDYNNGGSTPASESRRTLPASIVARLLYDGLPH